jgi:UDP-3-O-[3-hydroxymyristoyl] glucosamine N-acyltransferase
VGHLTIGDNAKIGARSGVEGNVKPDAVIFGAPAIDAPKARRNFIHWRNLDDIVKKIYQLEKDFKNQKKDHE